VLKDFTSIGQDDAYVGVTSHTMERKQAREYSIGGSFPKSRNIGKSWRSPKFATVCCMRGDCDTLSSSNTSLDAYYSLQRSHLASQKIYFLHPHFPSEPFPDCLGQACTHKPIAQKKNIIKNLILSLVPISLPCGIANQPKKKIALQNPHLTFQVCAEYPCLCTICCGCTPCFLKDFSQALMALHYLLPLHTFESSSLSAA
jgi:hypothetical protein